jgi:hypothetical protein
MSTEQRSVKRPIFLFGMPRSGTTLIFETFARNPELGWFSYHYSRRPRIPALSLISRLGDISSFFRKAVTRSDQRPAWIERFRDGPSEAYSVWQEYCGEKFLYDYLLEVLATPEERDSMKRIVSQVLAWQGRSRFAAKVTGPARLGYIKSIFEDAEFVHIVRDGRTVVSSLLRIYFWKDTFRMREPAWRHGMKEEYLAVWEEHDRSPLVLAALQWRNVIERAHEECERHRPGVFLEIRYEDFLRNPIAVMEEICDKTDVPFSDRTRRWLLESGAIRSAGAGADQRFSDEDLSLLDALLGDLLDRYGYRHQE